MTIVRAFKSKRTTNRMVYVSHRKATRCTTGIAHRVVYIYLLVIKTNTFNNTYLLAIKLNCSLSASTPKFVLDKLLPLSLLLGIIGFLDVTKVKWAYFRGDGKICCEKSK